MSPSELCWSTTSSLMQLKIMSLCRSSLRTKVGKQKGKSKMGSIRNAVWQVKTASEKPPGCSGGGFSQHSPLPTGRASHRVTSGSWVGVIFCLPGARSHPSSAFSESLPGPLPGWAWPGPCPAVAEQGDDPACPILLLLPVLSQLPSPVMLLCSAELVFPRDANVFYGMNSHVNFDFILRKKAELVGWGCPLHHPPSLWGILSEFPVGNVQLEQWAALAARALGCCICLEDTPWANSCLWEESPSCQYYTDIFYRTEPSSGYVCLNQLKTFCTCSTPENDPFWILFPKNFRMNELHLPLPWMGLTDTTFCVGWRS